MKRQRTKDTPPRLARKLFHFLFPENGSCTTVGDVDEAFHEMVASRGILTARAWYWTELIRALPARILENMRWAHGHGRHTMKMAVRQFSRHPVYSAIGVCGLVLGLTVFFLFYTYFRYEWTYDNQFPGTERTFRILQTTRQQGDYLRNTPIPLVPAILEEFPDVESGTTLVWGYGPKIMLEDRNLTVRGFFADSAFLSMFPLKHVTGNPGTCMSQSNTVLISSSLAGQCFGKTDPLGRRLSMSIFYEELDVTVAGVFEDLSHTHFNFDILISFPTLKNLKTGRDFLPNWEFTTSTAYITTHQRTNPGDLKSRIGDLLDSHTAGEFSRSGNIILIQPLRDIHLRPEVFGTERIRALTLFLSLALCVLLIACANLTNLATARASVRMKEIGIRKTTGAHRRQLIRQFMGESLFTAALGLPLAATLTFLLLPRFNELVQQPFKPTDVFSARMFLEMALITIGTGILAGAIPALILSSLKPVSILKGEQGMKMGSPTRSILVVGQFTISIGLVLTTLFMSGQLRFLKQADWGWEKDRVLEIWAPSPKRISLMKDKLLENSAIESIAMTSNTITHMGGAPVLKPVQVFDGEGSFEAKCQSAYVDDGFVKTFGLNLIEGVDLGSSKSPSGTALVNESFARVLGRASLLDRTIELLDREYRIVGVVRDFHMANFHKKIDPAVFPFKPEGFMILYLRLGPGNIRGTIESIKTVFQEFFPEEPFEYDFVENKIGPLYQAEQRASDMVRLFAVAAVSLACLGLLGLAMFTMERRTKEVSVRKVLGANSSTIVFLLSKRFLGLILLANLFAWPAAALASGRWLMQFAYRIPLSVNTFLIGAAFTLGIVFVTIAAQVWRATRANPVDSLRHE